MRNENFFKNCHFKSDKFFEENGWKLYVPLIFRKEVLVKLHDSPLGAHLGVNKTLAKIQESYYWPRMNINVRKYMKTCDHCQVAKHSNRATRVPMGLQKEVEGPWDSISIDFLGPYPRSKHVNKFLFVVVDNFTKWCLLKP